MPRGRRNPNGAGSITLRKDGRYMAAAYVTTASGVRKRKFVYGKTWDEAHEKLVELHSMEHSGVPIPDTNSTVAQYLRYWLAEEVKPNRRPKTYQGYESVVRTHLVPGLGKKKIRTLRAQEVRAWVNRVRIECQCCKHGWDQGRDEKCCTVKKCCNATLSPRMVQVIHAVLRNALQHAVREELITRNVAKLVQVTTPTYGTGQGLSAPMAKLVLKELHEHRMYALYVLAMTLGMRRGELLGLYWDAVDLEKGTLTVATNLQRVGGELRIVQPKTRTSVRTLPLPSLAARALTEHRERQAQERADAGMEWREHGLVFPSRIGTPYEPDNLRRSWGPVRRKFGLTHRFHDLRHTCVTLLLDLGVPPHVVMQIAGHSDLDVTMGVYAHASLDEKRRALEKLDEALC
ncbi:site-specific integrase [Streptomyces sp. HNM0574]|uniref:tyrosine-type recombinase/integrase n=1 Tax=Streptomyces sp. HNM0574 TaxID=2714954 RepID=UPI00146D9832|nr:site-specific integrase [Streptomyces sp. HNM0574]NLU68470.1 site-specific integrase [Streptomyces sp. HNM0574]